MREARPLQLLTAGLAGPLSILGMFRRTPGFGPLTSMGTTDSPARFA